jgi:HlyD family secretion protein
MKSSPLSARRRWIAGGAILALVAALAAWQTLKPPSQPDFRLAKVERGPLTASVSASGTLNPVVSVQVGSQVSGQIKEVLVDFNSEVKRGQLIARIDPETFEYRVRQAQADVDAAKAAVLVQEANARARGTDIAKAQVTIADAKRDLERKTELVARQFISPAERERADALVRAQEEDIKTLRAQLSVAEAQVKNAEATVKQREAALLQARVDLERTQIRAPVDGVVIKRTIEPGQTVAASLQAPELFVIAQNLRDMQVDTSVDESEIGRIKVGQNASFTVDAFPGRTFHGVVKQVRKAAQNVSNVITYTVVVSAGNDDLTLLPGMTANVRLVTDRRESALKVPNAALRFKPAGVDARADAKGDAKPDARGENKGTSPASTGASGGGRGGQLQAFRERIEKELALDDLQKQKLDAAFAGVRDKFMALREAPEAERGKASERIRADLRERIAEFLDADQKVRFAALVAEAAGRQSSRGRVFVLDANRAPQAVNVRLGLSDGSMTEVLDADAFKDGDEVIVGANAPPSGSSKPASGGPRGL